MAELYAFGHGTRRLANDCVPVNSCLCGGDMMAIGFSNGSIGLYRGTAAVGAVELFKHTHAGRDSAVITVLTFENDMLVVGYADGTLCLYSLVGNRLVLAANTMVQFAPRCVDSVSYDHMICWGLSCDVVVLDKRLRIVERWGFKDWPIPVPLFDNHMLVVYKNGSCEQFEIQTSLKIKREHSIKLDLFGPENNAHFHKVDMVIDVKRVGPVAWLVVQRSGWTLFKWEDESLVKQISSGAAQTLTQVVHGEYNTDQECFGVLGCDGSLMWVHDANVQLIGNNLEGTVISVMYQAGTLQALCLGDDLKLYTADTNTDTGTIEWGEYSVTEEFDSSEYISGVHDQHVLVAKQHQLFIYQLGQFLSHFDRATPIVELENDTFSVLKNSTNGGHIIAGTSKGKLLAIDKNSKKVLHTLQIFSTPVDRILLFMGHLVATSRHSTVAVVDLATNNVVNLIPGNNVPISCIEHLDNSLIVKYENREVKSWDLATGESTQAQNGTKLGGSNEGFGFLVPIPPNKQTRPINPLVLLDVDKLVASLSKFLDSDKAKLNQDRCDLVQAMARSLMPIPATAATKSWHRLVVSDKGPKVGAVTVNASFLTVSQISHESGETGAYLISVWVLLVRLLLRSMDIHVESTGRLVTWVLDSTNTDVQVSGFASLATSTRNQHVRHSARLCLNSLVHNDDQQIAQQWQSTLPSNSVDIYSELALQSLEILASVAIQHPRSPVARQVAESLQLYLTDDAPVECRDAAIEFIGRGWGIFENHFNPLNVLDALVQILSSHGYTLKSDPSEARRAGLILLCEKCIQDIARQNTTLLVSALVTHMAAVTQSLEARVTATRLLTNLVSSAHSHIEPKHLPTMIAAVVKTLDTSDASLRESTQGTSVISESTQFLASAMARFPTFLAFHKPQQRLAVSTFEQHALLALVYDLRTGTVVASLGCEETSGATSLTMLKFSPDGKQIAGVLDSQRVARWKLETGFMSLLQSFQAETNDGAALIPVEVNDGSQLEWNDDNKLKINT